MDQGQKDIIPYINKDFSIELSHHISEDELAFALAEHINDMIVHNLPKLIQLLYRIDISEKKLKEMLAQHKNYEAGMIIARMVIDRQKEKAKSREKFKQDFPGELNEELW
ncbi:MAG: hypothetical protein ACO29O_07935 [Chitinophagaceae bacterium]